MKQVGKGLLPRAAWVIDGWSELMGYVSAASIVAASVVITQSVIVRKEWSLLWYHHQASSAIWQLELSVYLLILATFLGASYTQKHEGHVGIDLVTYYVPLKPREIIHLIGAVVGFVVAVVIAWYAWPIWGEAIRENYHSESLWSPHLGFPYLLIPLGMTFLALQYIVYMGRKIGLLRSIYKGNVPPSPAPACDHAPLNGEAK